MRTSVFIAGGGPVGLSLALMLDRYGVDCVLVERNATTTQEPKANGLTERSMEIYRQLGIADLLLARAEEGLRRRSKGFSGFCVSLAGEQLFPLRSRRDPQMSPMGPFLGDQGLVEQVLYESATRCAHAQVHFATELVSFAQDATGVTVRTRSVDSGEEREWSAAYLVGADGVASTTRELAGLALEGPDTLTVTLQEFWRADFSRHPEIRRDGGMIISSDPVDPVPFSIVGSKPDGTRRSRFFGLLKPGDRDRPWDDAGAVDAIRRQVGVPDLDVELLGWNTFRMGNQLAARYRQGRVFLAGDSAHVMPASGGMGFTTGLQDVHNLAWKLAYVLKGYATDRLLDTYETERRPIAESNGDWSVGNLPRLGTPLPGRPYPLLVAAVRSGDRDRIAFALEDLREWSDSQGRGLGYSYEEGAVVPDGTAPPPFNSRLYTPTDRPGHRFPHHWTDLNHTHSTLDWFDTTLTLVTGPLGTDWQEAAHKAATHLAIPITTHTLPNPHPTDGHLIGPHGAALVRPDGHTAWRRGWLDPDPTDHLITTITTLLDPGPEVSWS